MSDWRSETSRIALLPPRALIQVGLVMAAGSVKHGSTWMNPEHPIVRHLDAAGRHYLEYLSGIRQDKDSKLSPLAHLSCRALMALDRELQGLE